MTPTAMPSFSSLLRRFRRVSGLSQEALAALAGLSTHAVGDLERGYRQRPRKETIVLLSDALQLSQLDRIHFEVAAHRSYHARAAIPSLMPDLATVAIPADFGELVAVTNTGIVSPLACPLVGRAKELALCERHLAAEKGALLLIAGEPGVGRTRLLYESGNSALAHGWHVLAAQCHRDSREEPYAPILDAIMQSLRQQTTLERQRSLHGCSWLIRVLPELAETLSPPAVSWPVHPPQERRLLEAAIVRFFSNVAGAAGTLLLLDDLHLADTNTIELLNHLVRTVPDDNSLRIIGTYRDTQVDSQATLIRVLADLTGAHLAHHISLNPLAPDDAMVLLSHLLPDHALLPPSCSSSQLLQRTGGVPFFLVHCAQELQSGLEDARKNLPESAGIKDNGHGQLPTIPVPG